MAGYQLPAKYPYRRWKDMALLLIPVMTIMIQQTTAMARSVMMLQGRMALRTR